MKLLRPILYADPGALEVLHAQLLLGWGLILLWPDGVFRATVAYTIMASVAPEWVLGIGCAITGLGQLAALLLDRRVWRRVGMVLACYLWSFIAACLLGTWMGRHTTAVVTYPILATSAAWAVWRIR